MDAGKPDPRATPETLAPTLLLMVIKQRKTLFSMKAIKNAEFMTPQIPRGVHLSATGARRRPRT